MKKIIYALVSLLIVIIVSIGVIAAVNAQQNIQNIESTNEKTVKEVSQEDIDNNPIATIEIENMGKMKFVLYPDIAPESVNNFIYLANSGFYDGLTMHRIVTSFVAQGGDPDGTGAGGPGYSIVGEFDSNGYENNLVHQKGALAWARNTEEDSAGSQFYICLDDVTSLDGDYAVFGYMIEGEEVLDKLNSVSSSSGTPTEEVIIKSVSVDTKGEEYPEPKKILSQN